MNIFAKENDKVIVTEQTINYGDIYDKKRAKNNLIIGNIYTIERTEVHNWHTDVYLKEFPGLCFNSVNFEDYLTKNKKNMERILKAGERICLFCGKPEKQHYQEYESYYECDCKDAVKTREIQAQILKLKQSLPTTKYSIKQENVLIKNKGINY